MDAQTCMNCGAISLLYHQCKIRCQNCGFMLDCSDLDVGGEVKRATLEKTRMNHRGTEDTEKKG